MPKNWCFWTVVLTLESPLDCKEIQPVHPKGNQSWIFIGRTDAEAETPILWPPDVKNWFTGKAPDPGKIEGGNRRDDRGWDGWLASPTQWTWVWVNSGSWRWTGRPGVLWFMGSQTVRHDWVSEQLHAIWCLYRGVGPREPGCISKGWSQWAQTPATSCTEKRAKFFEVFGFL